jgi:hypothetical protein
MFWDSQGVLLSHFQQSGENVNFASSCEVLLKLQDAISRKHPCQLARRVLLPHDNARLHTARAIKERIQELQWELLEHLPYSPDLAPKHFAYDEEVEMEVLKWLRQQSKDFYAVDFDALVKQWDKCIDVGGDVES